MKPTKRPVLTMFGVTTPPSRMDSLPREVIKWMQSLDLTYSIKNVKKEFNNGFLVAQILSRYYPVTNDQNQNYKAIQMHQISNEISMAARKDNWEQITKFISKIPEITTRINDMETFIKNENGEILMFIVSIYQELTKRHILLEQRGITTDIDNKNKSYLLKDNGEIERLTRNEIDNLNKNLAFNSNMENIDNNNINQSQSEEDSKKNEEINKQNQQQQAQEKMSNSLLSRASNVVMKGDVKPMTTNLAQAETGFKVKISEPRVYETTTRIVRQPKTNLFSASNANQAQSQVKRESEAFANYNSLIQNEKIEEKTTNIDNPFLTLDEPLSRKIQSDFRDDFDKINIHKNTKFIYDFFNSIDNLSDGVLNFVINYIIKIIEDFYNILSGKQSNDFIDIFLILFNAYINLENYDDEDNKKFKLMHDGLINFFYKSLKNKNEEMFLIFKNIFIEKIFEIINDKEYSSKINNLCDLLFHILQPNNEQQVELFKMFKEKTKEDEEIMYECFSILHEKITNYNDSLIDGCLFYVLNGISNENPKIRYFSLQMLLKYATLNVNFVYNFGNKLEKLSNNERDRENCLIIIKIIAQSLKAFYVKKSIPKENNKKKYNNNNESMDSFTQGNPSEIQFANNLIKSIVDRFVGDPIFILLFTCFIYDYLYDNSDLYQILLEALFLVDESIMSFAFYDGDLDEGIKTKFECTTFRNPVGVEKLKDWNKAYLLKAFDSIASKYNLSELSPRDYTFIKFLVKDGLDVNYSEIFKTSFNFSKLIIKDFNKLDKVYSGLEILDSFVQCEPIQKFIFDEWYDNLQKIFTDIVKNSENEDVNKCKQAILETIDRWINNQKISQIVRDDIKKLKEIFPKDNKPIESSS
jgi:hypothetical protein